MKKLDIIIPCYNSQHIIRTVVEGILKAVQGRFEVTVILSNDHSPDHVWDEIRMLCREYPNVIGINLARNFGQQSARMAAIPFVEGDYVVFMDDDGQHDPEYIPRLVEELEEGYDIVYAAFENKKQAKWKSIGSDFHQITSQWLEEKPKGIRTSSYFIVRRYIVDELKKYPSPSPVIFGYLMKTTQNISSISVPHKARIEGESGYTLKRLMRLWLNAVTSFSIVPLRFASYLGFISSGVGMATLIFIVVRKLLHPEIAAGYTSTIAVILLFSGIVLLMLGLIGEYIGKMFMTINCVPQYVIKEIIQNKEEKIKDV